MRGAADELSDSPGPRALAAVEEAHRLLTERLLPYETAVEQQLYPAIAGQLGGPEAASAIRRSRAETERLTRRVGLHLRLAHERGGLGADQLNDLRSCLYGLHALLRLRLTQEDEEYTAMND